jgi:hypothetical protein
MITQSASYNQTSHERSFAALRMTNKVDSAIRHFQ